MILSIAEMWKGTRLMEYHVAKTGNDSALGTKEQPFLTISRAAKAAVAGDTVIVHAGVYREWVNPVNGGTILFMIVSRPV